MGLDVGERTKKSSFYLTGRIIVGDLRFEICAARECGRILKLMKNGCIISSDKYTGQN